MRVLFAFRDGWKLVMRHARAWFILYLCNLVFALVAAWPFHKWFQRAAGHSLLADQSAGAFDLTFIGDLLRNYKGFSTLISQVGVLSLAFVILSAFLIGGVLHMFVHHRDKFIYREFVQGGIQFFWRFVRLALYFLFIQIVLLGIFVLILMTLGADPMQIESDVTFFRQFKILFAVYCILALIIVIAHDYVKMHIVIRNDNPFRRSFREGLQFVWRNFGSVFALYLLNLGILIILFVVYSFIKDVLPAGTHQGTMLGFIFSQVFLIGRIGVKLVILSSAAALVQKIRLGDQGINI